MHVHSIINLSLVHNLTAKPNHMMSSLRFSLNPLFRHCRKCCSSLASSGSKLHTTSQRKYGNDAATTEHFITTPIFYVNAAPHIGHLYSTLLADAIHRWKKICRVSSVFTTGTDEHGLKIQQAAERSGQTPQQFCDRVCQQYKDLFHLCNVDNTDFIRTTEQRHLIAVNHFWNVLEERGYIYKGSYEGWYSVSDEAFVSKNLVADKIHKDGSVTKVSTENNLPVEWVKEDNFMFRLSEFGPQLTKWLDKKVIKPAHFERVVREWISDGLKDLSLSRQRERLSWGIPVPSDQSQTIYVWLDALVNYLTVIGYPHNMSQWPADCHVVGKDILKFHAVYWPTFLMAAGMSPPKAIFCHSHWTVGNVKMSKSIGNIVDPLQSIERFSVDGLRYFLLREGVPHHDGNFNEDKVRDFVNSELSNTLGNLLGRCTSTALNPDQIYPRMHPDQWSAQAGSHDNKMVERLQKLPGIVKGHFTEFNVYKGIEEIMAQLRDTNSFVQHHKPWALKGQEDSKPWLESILHVTMETLRVTGVLLQPVVPDLSKTLLTKLSVCDEEQYFDYLDSCHSLKNQECPYSNRKLGQGKKVLFQKIK